MSEPVKFRPVKSSATIQDCERASAKVRDLWQSIHEAGAKLQQSLRMQGTRGFNREKFELRRYRYETLSGPLLRKALEHEAWCYSACLKTLKPGANKRRKRVTRKLA